VKKEEGFEGGKTLQRTGSASRRGPQVRITNPKLKMEKNAKSQKNAKM